MRIKCYSEANRSSIFICSKIQKNILQVLLSNHVSPQIWLQTAFEALVLILYPGGHFSTTSRTTSACPHCLSLAFHFEPFQLTVTSNATGPVHYSQKCTWKCGRACHPWGWKAANGWWKPMDKWVSLFCPLRNVLKCNNSCYVLLLPPCLSPFSSYTSFSSVLHTLVKQ